MAEATPHFPYLLKEWRQHRRLSQLELAVNAGISQRHISFLETGRSNPSRQMVVALCDSLDVPLRERNALLAGAGFAPLYTDEALDDNKLAFFKDMLGVVIEHHEPFPAMVLDGRWNIVMANMAAIEFFGQFADLSEVLGPNAKDFQIIRLCMEADGLKPHIQNWPELMYALLQRCRRALVVNPKDEALASLIDDILSHTDSPQQWKRPDPSPIEPVLKMTLAKDGRTWSLFTMLAHFGTPEHITLQELAVESFYPADPQTREFFTRTR